MAYKAQLLTFRDGRHEMLTIDINGLFSYFAIYSQLIPGSYIRKSPCRRRRVVVTKGLSFAL